MTDLATLNKNAGGEKLPGFAFLRIGDGIRIRVENSKVLELPDDKGQLRTKLVINGSVVRCKGGIGIYDENKILTGVDTYKAGDRVAVWLPAGFGIGAVADAVKEADASSLADDSELEISLVERRDTGKPKPANVYKAKYFPPAGGTPLADLDDSDEPF